MKSYSSALRILIGIMFQAISPPTTKSNDQKMQPRLPSPFDAPSRRMGATSSGEGTSLPHDLESPLPAGAGEEAQRQPEEPAECALARVRRRVRPIDHERTALDVLGRDRAPEAGVVR